MSSLIIFDYINHIYWVFFKGEKCPCGAWVAPAFHIDSGKVDKIPSQPVMPHAHAPAVVAPAVVVPEQPHLIGAVAAFPVPTGSSGRQLGHNPLPERPTAASRLSSAQPVAAVQPRMSPSYVSPQAHLSAASTLTTVQSMDFEMGMADGGDHVSQPHGRRDNRDLETGINSIHMDVDTA